METSQLILIDDEGARPGAWRLDEKTRAVGRQGVAKAREALAEASRRQHDDQHPTAA